MSEISQELAAQMAAYFRKWAPRYDSWSLEASIDEWCAILREAAHIAAELPELVDPLLIEAREIFKVIIQSGRADQLYLLDRIDAGEWDNLVVVRSTLAGLKRGHALGVIEASARGQA